MDAFADDKRLWPPPIRFTILKLFLNTVIELQELKRMLTTRNESELGIVIVQTVNIRSTYSFYLYLLFFNQPKIEFWPALAV